MRILYVISQLRVGGAERQLLELVSHLDKSRYAPTVCSLSGDGPIGAEIKQRGVQVIALPRKHSFEFSRLLGLYHIVRERKYDLLHTFLPSANAYGCLAAKLAGVSAIVCSDRSVNHITRKHDLLLHRTLAALANQITANSEAVKTFLTERVRVRSEKVAVIYNGVDLGNFQIPGNFDVPARKKTMGMDPGLPVVGTVANFSPAKGYPDFFDAAAGIMEQMTAVQFLVVGEGTLYGEFQEYVRRIGISQRVFFAGFQRRVQDMLLLMDVFVLASLREGFANVILEAMSLARPVVATDVGGNAEAVLNDITGFLVPPGEPELIARSVIRLLRDRAKANAMGQLGRERIEKFFTVDRMVRATENLYESLMKERMRE